MESELESRIQDLTQENRNLRNILARSLDREFATMPDYKVKAKNKLLEDFCLAYGSINLELSWLQTVYIHLAPSNGRVRLALSHSHLIEELERCLVKMAIQEKSELESCFSIEFFWDNRALSLIEKYSSK